MNIDTAYRKRDQRLRKRLLQVLNAAKTRPDNGWASGRFIFDIVHGALPGGQQFESDDHFVGLMRDLISCAYVEERDDRTRVWQKQSLDWTSYRITAKGTLLLVEELPPDALVEDDRVRRRNKEEWQG